MRLRSSLWLGCARQHAAYERHRHSRCQGNNVDPDAPAWREQIETLRRSVEGWTGNDPQVLELDQAIAVAQAHDADSFLRDVERDGIWLAGESFHIRQARSIQVRS